jgi:hypothetical protein
MVWFTATDPLAGMQKVWQQPTLLLESSMPLNPTSGYGHLHVGAAQPTKSSIWHYRYRNIFEVLV